LRQDPWPLRQLGRRVRFNAHRPHDPHRTAAEAVLEPTAGAFAVTVSPGSIQSNQDRSELIALRLGTVEDCAKIVEFLATDLSDQVTGAVIPVDGGLVRG
jgi:NAD(P)-dependent dehydrogenase (short-subunit alcohol dehydrogenase family)